MTMNINERALLCLERLQIRSLTEADHGAIQTFTCGDEDLDDFLRTDALR
jgi:hypothetical protein